MSDGSYLFGGVDWVEVICQKCKKHYETTAWLARFGSRKLCDKCEKKKVKK